MIVKTAQYKYYGKDRLDITVKGQDPLGRYFAPNWSMVMRLKEGLMSEEIYTKKYKDILSSVPEYIWEKLLSKPNVTLVCYCASSSFCHRYILAEELRIRGATYQGEVK